MPPELESRTRGPPLTAFSPVLFAPALTDLASAWLALSGNGEAGA